MTPSVPTLRSWLGPMHTGLTFDLVGGDVLIAGAGPIGLMAIPVAQRSRVAAMSNSQAHKRPKPVGSLGPDPDPEERCPNPRPRNRRPGGGEERCFACRDPR